MRILLLNSYFDPEMVAASHLSKAANEDFIRNYGAEMEIFAPNPVRGIDRETRKAYKDKKSETRFDGKMRVHRIQVPFDEDGGTLRRTLRYLCMSVVMLRQALISKADVLSIASTPPTFGLVAALAAKWSKKPVVYNLQDIFPDSLISSGVTNDKRIIGIGRWMERFTYRHVTRISTISEDFRQNLLAKGVPGEKIDVVYNWIDENAVAAVPRRENRLVDRYNLDPAAFYVTYSGNIGHSQNLEMLVDIACELKEYRHLRFLLIGRGAHLDALKEYAGEKQADNMAFLPFQPYQDISHVFSIGDAGLVLSKPGVGVCSFPSKTWSIMSASRPVIASFDARSELRRIIEGAEAGVYADAGDKEALKAAILMLYNDRGRAARMGENGRKYILANLTREVGTRRTYEVLERAVREHRRCL